jgi:hypothetical protein
VKGSSGAMEEREEVEEGEGRRRKVKVETGGTGGK